MIRVLLADDQALVREGWALLLRRQKNIEIVGQARDGEQAVKLGLEVQPDVVLMDIRMPRMDGLEATRRIVAQRPATKVLMVTSSVEDALIQDAIQRGAWGYMSKSDSFDELIPALAALQAGQLYFSRTVREQYSYSIDGVRLVALWDYQWRDPVWTELRDRLRHAMDKAQENRSRSFAIRREVNGVRARVSETRAVTHQLLAARHDGNGVTLEAR